MMIGIGFGVLSLFVVWLIFGYRENWEAGVPAAWIIGLVFGFVWFAFVLPSTTLDGEGNEYFKPINTEVTKTEYRTIIDENGKELTTYNSHQSYLEVDECTQFYTEHFINNYGIECYQRLTYDTSYVNEKLKKGYIIK